MIEQLEREPKWYDGSAILIKLGIIAVIILALLIPSSWIQDLVNERAGFQKARADEVSATWATAQQVNGPVLVLPYKTHVTVTSADKKAVTHDELSELYVLPQSQQINADVRTQKFKTGVYVATGYNAKINLAGTFIKPNLSILNINPQDVLYDKARLVFGVTDMSGLKSSPVINLNGQAYAAATTADEHMPSNNGLQVSFVMDAEKELKFSYQIVLRGTNELNFLHTARNTDIKVMSDWAHPGFNGNQYPDTSTVKSNGFVAEWHVADFKRPFPQQWVDDGQLLAKPKYQKDAALGVRLQIPIDQYREVLRTTKYSTLIILLTFVSLFLTELIKKQRVHLFNYTLIGAAMVVYYTLLLSFSEQVGFNWAYLISSVSTITLVSLFTASLLKNRSTAGMFAGILAMFYGFIFVIVQLEELSLLVGSIALFMVIAALMYFSRKINWDQH